MDAKTCFKCGTHKPLDDFYAHPMMGDGHLGKCKECTKRDARAHRAANIERFREYDTARKTLPHRVASRVRVTEEWRLKHPDRRLAQQKVAYAIQTGALKQEPCWVCGETKVHAHHPDYSHPLSVVWLCAEHHKQAHHNT